MKVTKSYLRQVIMEELQKEGVLGNIGNKIKGMFTRSKKPVASKIPDNEAQEIYYFLYAISKGQGVNSPNVKSVEGGVREYVKNQKHIPELTKYNPQQIQDVLNKFNSKTEEFNRLEWKVTPAILSSVNKIYFQVADKKSAETAAVNKRMAQAERDAELNKSKQPKTSKPYTQADRREEDWGSNWINTGHR